MYKLDGICTIVDAKHVTQHLDEEKPEGVENEAVEQLAFADRILLNKVHYYYYYYYYYYAIFEGHFRVCLLQTNNPPLSPPPFSLVLSHPHICSVCLSFLFPTSLSLRPPSHFPPTHAPLAFSLLSSPSERMNSLAQTNITRHAQVDLIENDDEIKDKEAELKKIEERIRGINSAAPIYRTKQSAVDVKNVINLDAFSLDRVLSFDPEFLNTEGCVTLPPFDS